MVYLDRLTQTSSTDKRCLICSVWHAQESEHPRQSRMAASQLTWRVTEAFAPC
jgi:hypothetical protein